MRRCIYQIYSSDNSGKITLPQSLLSYLACDSAHADFTFKATDLVSALRVAPSSNNSLVQEDKKATKPVNKVTDFSVSVYPNPGTGIFELFLFGVDEKNSEVKLTIKDLTGRVIHAEALKSKLQTFINLNFLAKGNYYLELKNSNRFVTKKIVII